MLDEVIICKPCGMEFHQSFLSAHVEAFHIEAKQEEMVTLICASCSFMVGAQHKNSIIHHCFVTGHSIRDVDAQFNGFLAIERTRLSQILETGLAILSSNMQKEKQPPSPAAKSNETRSSHKKRPSPKKRKLDHNLENNWAIQTLVQSKIESEEINNTNDRTLESDAEDVFQVKEEVPDKAVQDPPAASMSCQKCGKTITTSVKKSHTIVKAVGHVLTHLPQLKLFRCHLCDSSKNRRDSMKSHLIQHHNGVFSSELNSCGTENDAQVITSSLKALFPSLDWKQSLNVLKYVR